MKFAALLILLKTSGAFSVFYNLGYNYPHADYRPKSCHLDLYTCNQHGKKVSAHRLMGTNCEKFCLTQPGMKYYEFEFMFQSCWCYEKCEGLEYVKSSRDFRVYPYTGCLNETYPQSNSIFCGEGSTHSVEREQGALNTRKKNCKWNMRSKCTEFKNPYKLVNLGKSSDMEVCFDTCEPFVRDGVNYSWFDETTGECFCLKNCPKVGSLGVNLEEITSGIAVMNPEDPDNVCFN